MSGPAGGDFCCAGCSAVHALLKARGLESFYSLRGSTGRGRLGLPAALPSERFSYLDDPEFLRDYADPDGRGMRLYLEGTHCAACVWLTEKLPEFVPGVERLRLDLSTGVARLRLGPAGKFSEAAEELQRLGYRPHPVRVDESEALRVREERAHLIRLGVSAMASGNIMLLAIALYAGVDGGLQRYFRWLSLALYLPVLLYSAQPFFRTAWAALRRRQASIDVPIVLGILIGTVASLVNLVLGSSHIYFDSLSAIVFLLLATRYLLRRVNQSAFRAARLMHFMAPSRARVSRGGQWVDCPTDAVQVGDLIQVLPGECFPVDGVVAAGATSLNRALLTGESLPVAVCRGAIVEAGTWNLSSPVEVEVRSRGASTRLGGILAAMEKGLTERAPIVAYADRVGRAFVVAVSVLSVVGFFVGLQYGWNEAVNRALAVAIIVCPCTFALATPLAMSLAIGKAARNGVLVKGAEVIERLGRARTVFLDKTGTLTEGELEVTNYETERPEDLEALVALESLSVHPVALAIRRRFERSQAPGARPRVAEFAEIPGWGIRGRVGGAFYEVRAIGGEGGETRVGVFRDGCLVGRVALSDRMRPDAREALDGLRALGLDAWILSGDSLGPVDRVARHLGLAPERARARTSPEGKSELVKSVPESLMVGDGANDAVALASASVGIAVRGGMEVSLRAAGAYSSRPGLMPVLGLVRLSRETLRVIRRNLVFAVLYNVVGVTWALSGGLSPLAAAILMPASALTVFLSTMAGTRALRRAFP
ncbi:MAG: cadmium-translocating P-type ATPase [Bdellovibrionales bacterium]|nr:cadmium-translocating P-type ATPase [Bdellovibrionales bacterium]